MFFHGSMHCFHDHNGIIDDNTDRKNDRKEGDHIHGEPEQLHEDKRTDQ